MSIIRTFQVFMKDFNNIVRHKFLAGTEWTFFLVTLTESYAL